VALARIIIATFIFILSWNFESHGFYDILLPLSR
jgi:hypothetical protein